MSNGHAALHALPQMFMSVDYLPLHHACHGAMCVDMWPYMHDLSACGHAGTYMVQHHGAMCAGGRVATYMVCGSVYLLS